MVWTLSWRNWNILEVQNVYYREVEREAVIAYSWTRRWVYNKQINKEVGVIIYRWTKKTGLADLGRSSLCRKPVLSR